MTEETRVPQGSRARDREARDAQLGIGRWDFDDDLLAAARDRRDREEPLSRVVAWPASGAPRVAIVLGSGGAPDREVELEAARADGVPILRRQGGGCAVVLDPGNVIVSVALRLPGVGGITSAFRAITEWLITGLAGAGVAEIERRGASDLALGDRKVGGACLWRTQGLVYYSTTLLVAPDLSLVERYLPHPPREPEWRRGRAHREFLGSLAEQDGAPADASRAAIDFAAALDRALAGDRIAYPASPPLTEPE